MTRPPADPDAPRQDGAGPGSTTAGPRPSDLSIDHEDFRVRRLSVRRGTFFRDPALLLDGVVVRRGSGDCGVADDAGLEHEAHLSSSPFDPVPQIELDGHVLQLVPPLRWYEVAGALIPVALLAAGGLLAGLVYGLLGGVIGLIAAFMNFVVFRSPRPGARKWTTTMVITLGAVALWVAATLLIHRYVFGLTGNPFDGESVMPVRFESTALVADPNPWPDGA